MTNSKLCDDLLPTDQHEYHKLKIPYISSRWDARADLWDIEVNAPQSHLNRGDSYQYFLTLLDNIVLGLHESRRTDLLDLGCGTGLLARHYYPFFISIIGVDLSYKMIQKALLKEIPHAIFIHDDIFHYLGLSNNRSHSVIISRGILLSHYGYKLARRLLDLCYCALCDNGLLFLDMLNIQNHDIPQGKTAFSAAFISSLVSAQ